MAYYDPLIAKWPEAVGATTQDKLDWINAQTAAGPDRHVPVIELTDYLRTNNLWLPIVAAQSTSAGAKAAVDYNNDVRTVAMDMSLPLVQQMLADLVTNSLLTQAQSDTIVAMKNTTVPWWQANGYPSPISLGDLALSGITGPAWHYQVTSVQGPDNSGASTAIVDFWNDTDPNTKHTRQVTSVTLTDADIASWAFRVARDLATRDALAANITTGTVQTVAP